MSNKPLTPKEFSAILDGFSIHDRAAGRLYATIEHGFAPEAPTDQEVNETIAKAQGWTWAPPNRDDPVPATWIGSPYTVADYQPVSNLGQALEAAAALGTYVEVASQPGPKGHKPFKIRKCNFLGWSTTEADTAADAARAISLYLFERIQEQGDKHGSR